MTQYLRRKLDGSSRNFVLIEGVSSDFARGMVRSWDDQELPKLAIASPEPQQFDHYALNADVSGTNLRNDNERGLVLVLCDGEQVADRQSLNLFQGISPSDLLDSPEGLAILAQQDPAVPSLDGANRAVRTAIVQAGPADRPSATAVASYFDLLAQGQDTLASLPALGGFRDAPVPGEEVDATRILENFRLVGRSTGEDVLRQASYADLRKRIERVLRQRPGARNDWRAESDKVMQQLTDGDPLLLQSLTFDDAREVLERRTEKLSLVVRREMELYQAELIEGSQAKRLPWHDYEKRADELGRSASRRIAAQELCALDESQQRRVFSNGTRAKLERQQRDSVVSGSAPSCPEAAIVRAAQQFGGALVDRVELLGPFPPASATSSNRTGAGRILTLACARLRLGGLLHQWAKADGEVSGLLLRSALDDDLGGADGVLAAFSDAGLDKGAQLPALQLKLYSPDRSTVQVDWRPDLDDAATLKAILLFAETPSLILQSPLEPTLSSFCGASTLGPVAVPDGLVGLAQEFRETCSSILTDGLTPQKLANWVAAWTDAVLEEEREGRVAHAETLALAGGIDGGPAAALTPIAPMKAEWLSQHLEALWKLLTSAEEPRTVADPTDAVAAATGIARTTASHYPSHVRVRTQDGALLPSSEGRLWSLYGGTASQDESGYSGEAFRSVVRHLLTLQPEAAGHLRCLAWGPGAADLLAREALRLRGTLVGQAQIEKIEVFCVGNRPIDRPTAATLSRIDTELRGERSVLQIRYINDLDNAQRILSPRSGIPAVHLALVTGLTEGGKRLRVESPDVSPPAYDEEVLFAPRVWQRPRQDRRTLLMPPTASKAGQSWLRLQNAVEDGWPEEGVPLRVPEVRTGTLEIRHELEQVHALALWVATLDRYATRDSLAQALGGDVAILHQERRMGGDSPLSLVLSQKSGGPADRAIGRSLRSAGIVDDANIALSIGGDLRRVASQGYGILALQAATSGAGINELVGHVVAFSLLATTATPWPLPPDCRVLLVSLDEYRHWFGGKRADLLAIALDTNEGGVHVACIEVKARRSDEKDAAAGAMDQLSQTLATTRWAAQPERQNIHSRLWLNRIAEAAYAVARESRFRLSEAEIRAIENFRLGVGSLEWAGVGLVFGPKLAPWENIQQNPVGNDIVPISMRAVPLTEALLREATNTDLTKLRTVETHRPPLQSSRTRRRPEKIDAGMVGPPPVGGETHRAADLPSSDANGPNAIGQLEETSDRPDRNKQSGETEQDLPTSTGGGIGADSHSEQPRPPRVEVVSDADAGLRQPKDSFLPPLLGWDAASGSPIFWNPAGANQTLNNGHLQIWGSSGMGKTQFTMCLLAQLARFSGSHFGIADFKNDYSGDTGFPDYANAEFLDLWEKGAPYNPLALEDESPRALDAAVIELRDTVDEAARAFVRIGHKQRKKIESALMKAYGVRSSEGRWPTLRTVNDELDAEMSSVMGDLTRYELFKDGPPLGSVVDRNVVFGLSTIPGNGQTTVLAAGFILSALLLKIQNLPPVPNTIRYLAVIDEAHRVSDFRAVQTMIREGRSKGLAVVLATQQPLDLPEVVSTNAQTKICFGLPDATIATIAARRLDAENPRLPEQIRTLGKGEAYLSLGGSAPRLVRMVQAYRDSAELRLPTLHPGGS